MSGYFSVKHFNLEKEEDFSKFRIQFDDNIFGVIAGEFRRLGIIDPKTYWTSDNCSHHVFQISDGSFEVNAIENINELFEKISFFLFDDCEEISLQGDPAHEIYHEKKRNTKDISDFLTFFYRILAAKNI